VYSILRLPDNRKEIYSHIEKELGKEIADKWLHETLKQDYATVKQDNQNYLQELSEKYKTFLDIPEINEAIADFLGSDVDHCSCLKEQGIAKAFEHIVNVYQSGFKAAQGLKSQNESAKSRMISSVNQLQPAVDRMKSFSRADIKSMSPEDFSKNEKAIFEQMSKGLIK
jgi:hypothetical protein